MIEDKSQQQSAHEGDKAFVSQPVLDQSATFKKWMALSTGDYIIICCLAILLLVLFSATVYMDPLDFFHIMSKEQLQALRQMKQESFQEIIQESLAHPFKNPIIEHLLDAGWNSVWAFLCFLPQMIFGVLFGFCPLFVVFNIVFKRDVKEMMKLWETLPEQQQLDNQSLNRRL
ncbi:hypothetical protein [Bartonella grahamii]|uniref:hypothetical protein n=1 Tax=Bartonella grahamii TaxID=33045 RepID=UPI001ABBDDF4|nr:hypothetical protein [Bartonella grahamii]